MNSLFIESSLFPSTRSQVLQMLQLLEDDLNFARVGGVDLDPVDDLVGKIGRVVPDRVVPLSIARSTRLQTGFNVNASLDASCVLGGDPAAIDFADRRRPSCQPPCTSGVSSMALLKVRELPDDRRLRPPLPPPRSPGRWTRSVRPILPPPPPRVRDPARRYPGYGLCSDRSSTP